MAAYRGGTTVRVSFFSGSEPLARTNERIPFFVSALSTFFVPLYFNQNFGAFRFLFALYTHRRIEIPGACLILCANNNTAV